MRKACQQMMVQALLKPTFDHVKLLVYMASSMRLAADYAALTTVLLHGRNVLDAQPSR